MQNQYNTLKLANDRSAGDLKSAKAAYKTLQEDYEEKCRQLRNFEQMYEKLRSNQKSDQPFTTFSPSSIASRSPHNIGTFAVPSPKPRDNDHQRSRRRDRDRISLMGSGSNGSGGGGGGGGSSTTPPTPMIMSRSPASIELLQGSPANNGLGRRRSRSPRSATPKLSYNVTLMTPRRRSRSRSGFFFFFFLIIYLEIVTLFVIFFCFTKFSSKVPPSNGQKHTYRQMKMKM